MAGGMVASFLAGLLGIGGGIIFVPCLYFIFFGFFMVPPDVAVPVAAHLIAVHDPHFHFRRPLQVQNGHMDTKIIRHWAPFILLGVISGTLISKIYGGKWLATFFDVFLSFYSLRMLLRPKARAGFAATPSRGRQHFIVFLVATFASLPGIAAAP